MAERAKRGIFGTLVLWLFVAFNLFALWVLSSTFQLTSEKIGNSSDSIEKAIIAVLGGATGAIEVGIWLIGDLILGLLVYLTRGKRRPGALPLATPPAAPPTAP